MLVKVVRLIVYIKIIATFAVNKYLPSRTVVRDSASAV
nr:MAG TPA: hypothetical protein [Crassvirales sp.]